MAEFRLILLCMWSKEGFVSLCKDSKLAVDSGYENEEESMEEDD